MKRTGKHAGRTSPVVNVSAIRNKPVVLVFRPHGGGFWDLLREVLAELNMRVKTYLVRFKPPGMISQLVIAASAEIQGEHIVMLDSHGKLVAVFNMEIVESWTESLQH